MAFGLASPAHLVGALLPAWQTGCLPSLQINGSPLAFDLSRQSLAVELSPQAGTSPSGQRFNFLVESTVVLAPSVMVLVTSPVLVSVKLFSTLAVPEVPSAHFGGNLSTQFAFLPLLQTGGFPSGTDLSPQVPGGLPSEQAGRTPPVHFFWPITSLMVFPSFSSVTVTTPVLLSWTTTFLAALAVEPSWHLTAAPPAHDGSFPSVQIGGNPSGLLLSLHSDGLAPPAHDGGLLSAQSSGPFLTSVDTPSTIVLTVSLPLASVVLIVFFSLDVVLPPSVQVVGGRKSVHVG